MSACSGHCRSEGYATAGSSPTVLDLAVGYDADYLRRAVHREMEPSADRIAAGPQASRHGLVDDRDGGRHRRVEFPDAAARNHPHADGVEIVRSTVLVVDELAVATGRRGIALEEDRTAESAANEWHHRRQADASDARQAPDSGDEGPPDRRPDPPCSPERRGRSCPRRAARRRTREGSDARSGSSGRTAPP